MSSASDLPSLDIREQLARIDHAQAEIHKFQAETGKLVSEQRKLIAEQNKLGAEAMKFDRDRGLAPWLAIVAIAGGLGGILAGVTAIGHVAGWFP